MEFECDVNYGISETEFITSKSRDKFECDVNYGISETLDMDLYDYG